MPKIKRTCQTCGKPLKRNNKKYCSKQCYYDFQKAKEPIKLICAYCNKQFFVRPYRIKEGAKYCSVKCAGKANRSEKLIRECKFCGSSFKVLHSSLKFQAAKYCSKECFFNDIHDNKLERICEICGKVFKVSPSSTKKGRGKYCSKECQGNSQRNGIVKNCKNCGKEIYVTPSLNRQFCSEKCARTYFKGKNSPHWKGGISAYPYCELFNDEFKERVRKFWDRKCGLCNKSEQDNNKKLSVHHINYDKQACCSKGEPLFIALCSSCHTKTNYRRDYWEHILTEYIMIWYNGESYQSK